MRRSLFVALAVASAAVLLGSCADDTAGPRQPLTGRFAVVPNFGALAGGIVEVAEGRFVLTRIPGGAVAVDTVIEIPSDADSVDLAVAVPVFSPGETFNLTIRLISPSGDTVFAAGPIEVSPTTSGTPVPVDVPLVYVGTGAEAAGIQILSPATTTFTGEPVLLTAVALDSSEVAIPGTPIGWESLDSAIVQVTADPQFRGLARGASQRGVARLVATLVTGQTDTVLVTNQPLPTALVAESGGGQSGRADSLLPLPLVARVTAADGLGVSGLWVRFAVTSGGGIVSPDSVLTDATGRASVSFTLARSFAPHVVTATTPWLGAASAVFNATLVFEPPANLEIMTGDGQAALAGTAVSTAPQVRVLDANGLPVPGVTVTFSVTGGAGVVAGGTPVTDTLGLAAVTSWTLGTTAGPNALQAEVSTLTATFTATGIAGSATQLALVSGDGQTGNVGQALSLPLAVRAVDANGNGVAGATVDWNAAAGNVSAPTTVTDADGFAQVTWTLGTAPGLQAATATLNGTAATVGFTATAGPGAATRLAFTVEPTQVREDSAITPAVQVTAYDAFDNVATAFTGTVTVELLLNPGGAALGGTTSVAAVLGVATFADLSLNAFGTGYTLLATATGLASDTSAAFTVLGALGQALWINPAGGNWSVGANWSTGAAPGATDTASITLVGTYTVSLDQNATVGGLIVGGATGTQTLAQTAGVLTVNGDAVFGANAAYALDGGSIGGGTFTNAGAMAWSGGAVTGTTSLNNVGTITLSGSATKTLAASATLSNTGTLAVEAGALAVGGTFAHVAGAVLRGGGTLDLAAATVTAFEGEVRPGTSPGLLTIAAPAGLALGANAVVTMELGGTATAGTDFDQLRATGQLLTLGGTLNVTLISPYFPGGSETWPLLAGVTGAFATVNLPPLDLPWTTYLQGDTLYLGPPPVAQVLFAGDSAGSALNSGIFSVNPDGSSQFQITTEGPPGETNVHPRWSPDRSRITYSARSLRADPNQLHVRTADGSVVRHLTSTTDTSTFKPRYSPDGVHLAFECGNGGYPTTPQDVCVIADVRNPLDGMGDGAGKVYVTDAVDATLGGPGAFAWNPRNPDQLAVVRDSVFIGPTAIVGSVIWLVKFDGSGATPLGTKVILDGAGAPVRVYSMDWAPDGSFIAFEGTSGGTRSIFRIEVGTGIVTQLTTQNQDFGPVVSPDNTEILFGRTNDLWTLMKIPATGGNVLQMSDYMNFAPAQAGWDWSPDGTEIAVTEDATTGGVVISKIRRETTATSFFSDALAGKLGRRGSFEIQDRQPSWRP